MKKIYLYLLGSLFLSTACETDLDQFPSNQGSADSLTDFEWVVRGAYFYQHGSITPMAVMGDFRADNAYMFEAPYTEFDDFDGGLTAMDEQFMSPFYTALYKSIINANVVIANSTDSTLIGEARFLRALSYFKLIQVFGDVSVNLEALPSAEDQSIQVRQSATEVYNSVVIPDLEYAITALDAEITDGRASKYAAEAILGKVYMHMGNYTLAETHLENVISGADAAGISLQANFADIFSADNELNSEIIFATQVLSGVEDEYTYASEFTSWYSGGDTKSENPVDADLVLAFDNVAVDISDATAGDLRRAVTIDDATLTSPKYDVTTAADNDWIEIRYADVIMLYAEALNENDNADGSESATILALLDDIRTRAGLNTLVGSATTQDDVRTAILDERRLEFAFEGQRWFDLVRTGTVDSEMGETIDENYHVFPIPISEVLVSDVIEQNAGY